MEKENERVNWLTYLNPEKMAVCMCMYECICFCLPGYNEYGGYWSPYTTKLVLRFWPYIFVLCFLVVS